jgi:CheY-like chemotaxis protein
MHRSRVEDRVRENSVVVLLASCFRILTEQQQACTVVLWNYTWRGCSCTKVRLDGFETQESSGADRSRGGYQDRGCRKLSRISTAKTTVIVVDDDLSMRRALRMLLTVAGFEVRVFDSADALLASNFPTVDTCLLLDIYMPGISGLEVLELLANRGQRVPTVLMSGRDDEVTRKLARKAKRTTCLFKPFDQSAILRAIQRAIGRALTPGG